jgi:prepilin-type processing-associated H-X9-DG protein
MLADIEQAVILNQSKGVGQVHGDPRHVSSRPHKYIIPLYLCPSDGAERGTNYRFNLGADVRGFRAEQLHGAFGPVGTYPGRRMRDIADGLSNTAVVSESLVSQPDRNTFDPRRDSWAAGFAALDTSIVTNEFVLSTSAAAGADPSPRYRYCGLIWASDHLGHAYYNHVVAPNSSVINSMENSISVSQDDLHMTSVIVGVHKASSVHPGAVNVLRLDGSVSFVSETVDLNVWQSLGTAAGSETLKAQDVSLAQNPVFPASLAAR